MKKALILLLTSLLMLMLIGCSEEKEEIVQEPGVLNEHIIQEEKQEETTEEEAKEKEVIYSVSYLDNDGTLLQKTQYKKGEDIPEYEGKMSNKTINGLTYKFSSWENIVSNENEEVFLAIYTLPNIEDYEIETIIEKEKKVYVPVEEQIDYTVNDQELNDAFDITKNTNVSLFRKQYINSYPNTLSFKCDGQNVYVNNCFYINSSADLNECYVYNGYSYQRNGNYYFTKEEKSLESFLASSNPFTKSSNPYIYNSSTNCYESQEANNKFIVRFENKKIAYMAIYDENNKLKMEYFFYNYGNTEVVIPDDLESMVQQ